MMNSLPERMEDYMNAQSMLAGTKHILCALSGGADSVCLLSALKELSEKISFTLSAAHYHHGIRGAEADRDRDFVSDLCARLHIPLEIGYGDVPTYAGARHIGMEEAGRELRYAFLAQCAASHEGCLIATAHHADDNAETVLLNLVRGTGLRGLCGIPPVRGNIIRPLLCVTRAEIEAYLSEMGLPYVEDSTNADENTPRNLIRHKVMPVLRALNPNAATGIFRMTETLSEDEALLLRQAEALLPASGEAYLDVAALERVPAPVQVRAFQLAAGRMGVRLSQKHLSDLRRLASQSGERRSVVLPEGLLAVREFTNLRFCRKEEAGVIPETPLRWNEWQTIAGGAWRIFWGEAQNTGRIYGKFQTFRFKKENICGNITVRSRREGDFLRIAGRNTKTLKKWMTENRIPAGRRDSLPVFADRLGVVAAVGVGAAERASAVPENADCVLIVSEGE